MLGRKVFAPKLFYRFSSEAQIPEDHLLRRAQRDSPRPPVRRVTEDVDIRTLDRGHGRPGMGVAIWRGTWFPYVDPAPR